MSTATQATTTPPPSFDYGAGGEYPPDLYNPQRTAKTLPGLDAIDDAALAAYAEHGYVAVHNVFTPNEVRDALDAIDDLVYRLRWTQSDPHACRAQFDHAITKKEPFTAAYHLGFTEFRGPTLLQPLIGNAVVTAGYLLTGSPLAAILAHVIMHGAAVFQGMEGTVQLPPHY